MGTQFLYLVLIFLVLVQEDRPAGNDNWMGKVNFVEIRSFWHIFRSFDRMWSFLILSLQVYNSVYVSSSFVTSFRWFLFPYPYLLLLEYIEPMCIEAHLETHV